MSSVVPERNESELTGDVLVVLRHAPQGTSWLREGLDSALVAAAFGQRVSLLFLGDGVLALLPNQTNGPLNQKGTQGLVEMLPLYDIDNVLVDKEALARRGLDEQTLLLPVRGIDSPAIATIFHRHRLVLNF
ncbi:sulfurtransferase complex subunit TusC [Pistricoccus aurantiacus]|uniref:Sulfurtransferase complex subunit TusC n=1 Tax=Pistricoccus aurantiacus TaxID=1883414 RepID=A0A5B8SSG7_9GAMM|nr:sulfurtransferase complex subunit TusC [Pistricoccus aurantiacus]QEA40019.1 sulfurtransferase complex subunit TusC [Pistricoccus aurantiacus]